MSNVVVFTHLKLDGVMQAGAAGRGSPRRLRAWRLGDALRRSGQRQRRRRRHGQDSCAAVWATDLPGLLRLLAQPKRQPFTTVLNDMQKYVASRTLQEPLPWSNSTLLKGEAGDAVGRLKEETGKDVVVLGSGELIQSLMRRNAIDH